MQRREFMGAALATGMSGALPAAQGAPGMFVVSSISPRYIPAVGDTLPALTGRQVGIVHGPRGSGKTGLALRMAIDIVLRRQEHVFYVRGRESFEELQLRIRAGGAVQAFDLFSCQRGCPDICSEIPRLGTPRIWVEDPAWGEQTSNPPFFFGWLVRNSPIPCGLVVIDALSAGETDLREGLIGANLEDALAPHQIGALQHKIPRLVVVDTPGAGGVLGQLGGQNPI